jgi:hypothetical protein
MSTISQIKANATEAQVPLRELGSRSGITYQRVCDAFKGWVQLRDPELAALEAAVHAAIRARAEKFTKMLTAERRAVPA